MSPLDAQGEQVSKQPAGRAFELCTGVKHATVIMANRDLNKSTPVAPDGDMPHRVPEMASFGSVGSVRAFAKDLLAAAEGCTIIMH